MDFEIEDLRDGYRHLCEAIYEHGEEVSPRGMLTYELLNSTVKLNNPRDALPVGINRKPNLSIAAGEAIQLMGGFTDPEMMVSITKVFSRFFDGGTLMGAYGPRIRTQMESVVDRLRKDPDSRQAIACIWDPLHDGLGAVPRDLPCTVFLQFVIRDRKLSLITTMRSNDVWKGVCYDFFQFTQLQLCVARILGLEPGPYYHHANSLHLYDSDVKALGELIPALGGTEREPYPDGVACGSVKEMQEQALWIWSMDPGDGYYNPSDEWYRQHLSGHVRSQRLAAP